MKDMVGAFVFFVFLVLLLSFTDNAFAADWDIQCGTNTEVTELVINTYEEVPVFVAESNTHGGPSTRTIMGLVNYETGTFSIIEKVDRGTYCLISIGHEWRDL